MDKCIFCKIADGEIPASKVYEDEHVVAFNDINPGAPVHILIIPRRHISGIAALSGEDRELMGHIVLTAARLAKEKGIEENGYRVVVNQGEHAGQSVPHLHLHLLGGRALGWPPG